MAQLLKGSFPERDKKIGNEILTLVRKDDNVNKFSKEIRQNDFCC